MKRCRLIILLTALVPITGWAGCAEHLKALSDPTQDQRDRAGTALYDQCDPATLGPEVGASLRRSLDLGTSAAGIILLLGHFPGAETTATLEAIRKKSGETIVKLHPWGPVASPSLAASVALARLGNTEARDQVLQAITAGELGDSRFLLSVLKEIDDPALLTALSKRLSDTREIPGGVPSGARPQSRVCDLATESFGARFKLSYSFKLSPGRQYTDAELAEARTVIERAIVTPK